MKVLRTFIRPGWDMYFPTGRYQCAIVHFLILKSLSLIAIQAELTSVYESEVLFYRQYTNSIIISLKRERNYVMIRDPGVLSAMNLTKYLWL
jgi:hypothetical protein